MTTPTAPDAGAPDSRRPVLVVFTSHWLAMTGLGLVLTAIVGWACLLPATLKHRENPYIGLATGAVAGAFVLGLVLTPIGLFFGRRRLRERLATAITDKRTAWHRFLVFLVVTSVINLLIASQLVTRALHSMESRQFCGSCHVMTPEARAFEEGPHASLQCVDCHVGNGALGLIKSKLQGSKQLWCVLTDTVPKPIEGAIASGHMVPAAETCEECHWKQQPAAARVRMIRRYAADEKNTPETTLLTMNVGGSKMGGIHGAHNGDGIEIRFVANDKRRQDIPLVEYRNTKTGVTRTYVAPGVDAASLATAPRITMQCFDCHNRPAHAFQMPDRAVDRAFMLGRMSASLPFLKKTAVEVLKAGYTHSDAAAAAIPAAVAAFYEKSHPDIARTRAADVKEAGAVVADIYAHNVYPEYAVDWGTYPDNRGHQDFPGCFRCHGGKHTTATGETLTNNCFKCHFPAAVGDTKTELLQLLGVDDLLHKLEKK
jgi:nitrate/TMAO reductase-like tetraheme cytochrome c subunit